MFFLVVVCLFVFLYRVYLCEIQCGKMKFCGKLINVNSKVKDIGLSLILYTKNHLTGLWGDLHNVPGILLASNNFIPE